MTIRLPLRPAASPSRQGRDRCACWQTFRFRHAFSVPGPGITRALSLAPMLFLLRACPLLKPLGYIQFPYFTTGQHSTV